MYLHFFQGAFLKSLCVIYFFNVSFMCMFYNGEITGCNIDIGCQDNQI
jgi:hypothetical protein